MSVLAVTFDVDGTLWDTRQLVREALNRVLTALVDMAPSENTLSLPMDRNIDLGEATFIRRHILGKSSWLYNGMAGEPPAQLVGSTGLLSGD